MKRWLLSRASLTLVVLALGLAGTSWARRSQEAASTSPVIAGYEQLRGGSTSDAAKGEILLGELNCLSCHAVSDASRNAIADRITTKPAPDLQRIGRRATPGWLRTYIEDPGARKPRTTMPNGLHAFNPDERSAIADRLTHFLIGQSGPLLGRSGGTGGRATGAAPQAAAPVGRSPAAALSGFEPFRFHATVERGRETFHTIGCVACHAAEGETDAPAVPDVPLPDLAAKTSVTALREFLLDPAAVRHGGRMPAFYLSDDEATDLAVYLLREQEPDDTRKIAGFEFEYFLDPMPDEDAAGFFTRPPPDFDDLTVEGAGHTDVLSLDLPIATRRGNHMFRFNGVLPVDAAGVYTFVLTSDRRSGSELLIDGRAVATKDRETGREITAELRLGPGDHPVEITYYIRGDTPEPFLEVTIAGGPIGEPVALDRHIVYEAVSLAPPDAGAFELDPGLASEGRRLFREVGCASCHALASAAAGAAPIAQPPPLEELDPTSLAGDRPLHAGRGAPRYDLAPHQRRALGAALSDLEALATPRRPAEQVVHTLGTYNCYACHQRRDAAGVIGGPDDVRGRHFRVVDNMDLGDEGRIPPTLTGIGGKLKPEALASVLADDRQHVRRNYMEARMPRFGGDLIGALPAAFERVDAVEDDLREPSLSPQAIEDGRMLVGSDGLRCITCHAVGPNLAQGISTVNLATVYDRVRPGWLRRLLEDPHSVNEGTRMLAYWTDGTVIHPDVAGGTAEGQIDAILTYMSLGPSMPAPEGTDIGEAMVLAPDDEPVIFRTFMTDASPRSILVGYPESVHVAFDANVMRLAKAWRGGFYDAQGTWSGRAGRFLDPYGEDVINMPPGPALAFLDDPDAAWPPAAMNDRNVGGQFAGYRLDQSRRPVFMYRLGAIAVEESVVPVVSPGGSNLVRRFSLESGDVADDLYLLVAEGDGITPNDDGSWTVDGSVTVAIRSNLPVQPFVRTSQGVRQLLLPIGIIADQAVSIDVEISW